MRAARRRKRTPDPLASPEAVRSICDKLRAHLPELIPTSENHLRRFLYAVRHIERHVATDTLRGRPAHWAREQLTGAAGILRHILERETGGRVSVSSFIGQYLALLQFPSDVTGALSSGHINLQEAAQLARLSAVRLGSSSAAARARRSEILQQHLAVQGSQTRLRARVKELLGETSVPEVTAEGMTAIIARADELLEIDPSDTRHMFWEEMKRLFFAMREIEPEDLDEQTMDDFLQAMDGVSNVLYRIEKRRQKRARHGEKLSV